MHTSYKNEYKTNITPEEAAALAFKGFYPISIYQAARDVFEAFKLISAGTPERGGVVEALAAVYLAGRLDGIREERAKRRGEQAQRRDVLEPCPNCGANRGTILGTRHGFYCRCEKCGAQAIRVTYDPEGLNPTQEHRAQRETLAQAVRYWNRGDLI